MQAEQLDAAPVEVDTHGGSVVLIGAAFARAALQQLQEPGGAAQLPRRLYEARSGSYGFFAAVLGAPRGAAAAFHRRIEGAGDMGGLASRRKRTLD